MIYCVDIIILIIEIAVTTIIVRKEVFDNSNIAQNQSFVQNETEVLLFCHKAYALLLSRLI